MPGLVPGIHVLSESQHPKTWMAGTSPAMTKVAYRQSNFLPGCGKLSPKLRQHRLGNRMRFEPAVGVTYDPDPFFRTLGAGLASETQPVFHIEAGAAER